MLLFQSSSCSTVAGGGLYLYVEVTISGRCNHARNIEASMERWEPFITSFDTLSNTVSWVQWGQFPFVAWNIECSPVWMMPQRQSQGVPLLIATSTYKHVWSMNVFVWTLNNHKFKLVYFLFVGHYSKLGPMPSFFLLRSNYFKNLIFGTRTKQLYYIFDFGLPANRHTGHSRNKYWKRFKKLKSQSKRGK